MRSRLLVMAAVVALAACGGATEVGGNDGGAGADGGAGSSSGSSGGSSGASSSSGSSSGGSSSSSGGSSSGGSSSSSSSSSSGASSSGGSSGSSSGGGSPVCPASPPSGGACSPVGVECEYGNAPNLSCNTIVVCTSSGWSTPPTGYCPAGTCPATFFSVPAGQPCTPDGLDCAYPQGQCNCAPRPGPGGLGGAVWQCFQPSGCPEPRPRLGSACSQPNLVCNYGACSGGIAVQCNGSGYWEEAKVPCPV